MAAIQRGNVVYTAPGGATRVLTETGADGTPVLSPDGRLIAFTRLAREGNGRDGDPPVRDLWVIGVDGQKAKKLVTGRPQGNEGPEQVLAGIDNPVFSPDGSTVYFMTAAWTTSSAIHSVRSTGGAQRYLTSGNSLAVIRRGKHAGALMVTQHRYMDGHGSWNPQVLVSPSGKKIKVVGEGPSALQSVEAEQ
jgi:Tol biopolymer transport system component